MGHNRFVKLEHIHDQIPRCWPERIKTMLMDDWLKGEGDSLSEADLDAMKHAYTVDKGNYSGELGYMGPPIGEFI